jgi:hypothetical protein
MDQEIEFTFRSVLSPLLCSLMSFTYPAFLPSFRLVSVQLVEVPNKAKDWDRSLTPHVCFLSFSPLDHLSCFILDSDPNFSLFWSNRKPATPSRRSPPSSPLTSGSPSTLPRSESVSSLFFLELTSSTRTSLLCRWSVLSFSLAARLPSFSLDADKVRLVFFFSFLQLCGYDFISRGSSPFCHLFTDEEWLSVEYYFDVRVRLLFSFLPPPADLHTDRERLYVQYHYMMGYGNSLSPYLGIPWVKVRFLSLLSSSLFLPSLGLAVLSS